MNNGQSITTVHANGPGLTKADLSTRFSEEQYNLILDTCCGGASKSQAGALIAIAEARGLNPILQECYFVERQGKWSVQASIDSLRAKAEQTGLYDGQDEPEYEYNDRGEVALARVKVWRKDWPRPAVGVARWDEYVQTTREGKPTKFWKDMPHNQLAKCAEALALRKAFPVVLAKIYVTEEMDQADNEAPPARQVTPAAKSLPAPSAPENSDAALVAEIFEMIDRAETKAALNKVAAATKRGWDAKKISAASYSMIAKASRTKSELLSADRPSEPKPVGDDTAQAREPGEVG